MQFLVRIGRTSRSNSGSLPIAAADGNQHNTAQSTTLQLRGKKQEWNMQAYVAKGGREVVGGGIIEEYTQVAANESTNSNGNDVGFAVSRTP